MPISDMQLWEAYSANRIDVSPLIEDEKGWKAAGATYHPPSTSRLHISALLGTFEPNYEMAPKAHPAISITVL